MAVGPALHCHQECFQQISVVLQRFNAALIHDREPMTHVSRWIQH